MLPDYPVIDAHVHIMPWDQIHPDAAALISRRPDIEAIQLLISDPHRLIDYMDERNVEKLVMINYITPTVVGFTEEANNFSANMAKPYPERLIPFGGIDPRRVADVGAEMDHLLDDLGLRGIKLHPPHQLFHVNDYLHSDSLRGLATVYEKCIEYDVPVMVHTGTSVFPRARNKYGRPLDIDDVLVDFPELKVIIAHGGRPLWMDQALFLLRRWPNAYLDISSVPPKRLLNYFPWIERVAGRAMFGSDWPGPGAKDLGQNIEDFYGLPLSEESKRQILYNTAENLFSR
jgi:predicted TIM-barrel fold metal-dependent hydrolase